MKPSDELQLAHEYLGAILERIDHRSGGKARRVDVAAKHLEEWASIACPPNANGPRGGSSSPVEVEDRVEEARLASRVSADQVRLPVLVRRLAETARDLDLLVTRNVETVHPGKLPKEEPGCVSCAREWRVKGVVRGGGHWAPVRADVKGHGLCDACYRHSLAAMREKKAAVLAPEHWPPAEYCDLMHRVSAAAAGRWLARIRRGVVNA